MATSISAALAFAVMGGASTAAAGGLHSDFQNPPPELRAGFVWFWPGPAVNDAEVRREIEEMSDAGYSRAHLFEVPEYVWPYEGNPPEVLKWGTPYWADRIKALFKAARDNDFQIDLSPSSAYPFRSPAVSGENVELSVQQLDFAEQSVSGPSSFDGPVPQLAKPDEENGFLVAATAAKLTGDTNADGEKVLDPASVVDLTSKVDSGDNLKWEVPAGDWVLFAFWQGPMYNLDLPGEPTTEPSGEVLDYLNRDSLDAATKFLDQKLFSKLGQPLTRKAGGLLHESAIYCYGNTLPWTGEFLNEFEDRRGYDLTTYLPALTTGEEGVCYGSGGISNTLYDFPDSAGERLRRDYAQTLTEMWVDNHVAPFKKYANKLGMLGAGRSFGLGEQGLNTVAVNKAYDVPEADHAHNNTIDWARTITSGSRLSGSDQALSEFGPLYGKIHKMTPALVKLTGDRQMVGGANLLHLHGYSYKTWQDEDLWKDDIKFEWPGWWPYRSSEDRFSAQGWADDWSPEIPVWQHMRRLGDYFGRAQSVLQNGEPVTDVAIFRDAYGFKTNVELRLEGFGGSGDNGDAEEPLLNSTLTRGGFSFDMVDHNTLVDRKTRVQGGKLIVQRPGYKALVIDPDASARIGVVDNTDAMTARAAWRLVRYAKSGLPIVFVGQYPERGASYRNAAAEDAAVAKAVALLKASPNVRLVADPADAAAALADLGVKADLSFEGTDQSKATCGFGAECIYSVHRRSSKGDYWFVWNSGPTASFTGSFKAGGDAPQEWDLWSGERRPIGLYDLAKGGRVEVPMQLAHNESVVIAFEKDPKKHVVWTNAEEVVADGNHLSLRSTQAGKAKALLSNGKGVSVKFPAQPAAIEPGTWDLHVVGKVASGTDVHDLTLTSLEDWRDIPEIKDSSGTGTYTTTVTLGKEWVGGGRGAYLELGELVGGVQVKVNGKLVHPAAVPTPRIDVGPYLHKGKNQISVELTTTLNNRLAEMVAPAPKETETYGLLGPVRLVPYTDIAVSP